MAELKICPNCGSNITILWRSTHCNGFKTYYRECKSCHWRGKNRLTIRGANRAWNRRAEDGEKT